MKKWLITPNDKKSIFEHQYWTKDGNSILCIICWRTGEFIVETEDDRVPMFEVGDDILTCGDSSEMKSLYDSNYEEHDYSQCDEETQKWFENYLEEGHMGMDLESYYWNLEDISYIINCPVTISEYEVKNNE